MKEVNPSISFAVKDFLTSENLQMSDVVEITL